MNHAGLVERLLSEIAAARAAVAASYQRLWPTAERTLRDPTNEEPGQARPGGPARPGGSDGEDRAHGGR